MLARPAKAYFRGSAPAHGPVHLNVGAVNAFQGFSPFLDYFRSHQAGSMTLARTAGGSLQGAAIFAAGGYLDPATGFLAVPCPADVTTMTYYFYTNGDPINAAANSGLAWNISWDGRGGTVLIKLLSAPGSQSINNAAGTGTFTFGNNPGNTAIEITITDRTDPPRNFHLWQQRYNTNWVNGEKFNPDWIAQAKKFYRLRLVDWMGTNVTTADMATFSVSSQIASESWFSWGNQQIDIDSGPKGLVPLSLCAQLANVTGCKLHVTIPYLATDQCVTDIATAFKNSTNLEVGYEYANEAWNSSYPVFNYCLSQGSTSWPGDGARANKYYGYRASQVMKIIRDVYADTTRWSGVLGTQTVDDPSVTNSILIGIAKWKTDTGSALNVNDLFKGLYVTGYFGDGVLASYTTSAVTKANPGVVTDGGTSGGGHGYYTGQKIRFFSNSMTQLNNVDATITVIDATHYSIGIDSSAYSTWVAGAGNYSVPAITFDLMDQSLTNFTNDPITWPTKYTYFNQQLAASLTNGYCSGGYVNVNCLAALNAKIGAGGSFTASLATSGIITVSAIASGTLGVGTAFSSGALFFRPLITSQLSGTPGGIGTYQTTGSGYSFASSSCSIASGAWETQKLIADANGLELNQYESGSNFVGDVVMTNPVNAQFTEYLLASGHSSEIAAVYAAGFSAFTAMGGKHPSKYNMAGVSSAFGTWGGMQTVPETPTNPVWQAVLNANGV